MNLLFFNLGTQELFIMLPLLVVFAYTLYQASTNRTLSSNQRILWIAIILLTNLLGWIAYWAIGKNWNARSRQRGNVA
ncbi:PLDc N-terminal domain-containing protein [Sphingobacterium sp. DN00404]|uniref:PLDc N-terminal domain-containing protein n=1 Tax=Sphingobacterium micropteri TaxID=2763501 RepID=A0ABR7YV02_9SPHI|nr:PLDc N-terminal domain-containing protein [Sphingobacterium micropteri]MBD1435170.1 PLDc N-terminal domain-containing protein [Sphingobacterium micropteri]